MNNIIKIKDLMKFIIIITIGMSGSILLSSFFFRSYSTPYSTPNNYEILYQGEVTEITYWNVTVEMVYTNYLNYSIRDYTYKLCNFTILNGTSNNELKLTTHAYYFVENEVEIGDIIIFYHYYGSIQDFKVIKKEVD